VKAPAISRLFRPAVVGLGWFVAGIVAAGSSAWASDRPATRGIGEGHPPQRADLSPAQRRLMARRAAEVRGIREALAATLGVPPPTSMEMGEIHFTGRIAGFRILESQELPDGRWRAVVEVDLLGPSEKRETSINAVLTEYLQFRSGLVLSRQRCREHEARLQRDLEEAAEALRVPITQALQACRADLAVIDRALEDLETKAANRLTAITTTSSPVD